MNSTAKVFGVAKRKWDRINFYMSVIATIAVVSVMFAMVIDVVGRWLRIPIFGVFEISSLLIGMTIYLGITYTEAENRHISVTLLTRRLTAQGKAIFRIVFLSICLAMFTWFSFTYGKEAYKALVTGEAMMGIIQFPLFPLKAVMFLGIAMLSLQLVIDIIVTALSIRHHATEELAKAKTTDETESGVL